MHLALIWLAQRNMMQKKSTPIKPFLRESKQTIDFLNHISELLKHQRRHFDDAVVTHCLRLIADYVQDKEHSVIPEQSTQVTPSGTGT